MVEIQNKEILDNISSDIKESNTAVLPRSLANTIQPVINVNPRGNTVVYRVTSGSTGATTIVTTPADKDFYLTGIMISYVKTATCDNTSFTAQCTPKDQNSSVTFIELLGTTLTAEKDSIYLSFPEPILLARNSGVSITGIFSAGAMTKRGMVFGKIVDTLEK